MLVREAILKIIEFEGGYANHVSDPGGATAYGIASRYNPDVAASIRAGTFTIEDAINVYQKKYWTKVEEKLNNSNYSAIAFLLFDARVSGHVEVTKIVEHTMKRLGLIFDRRNLDGFINSVPVSRRPLICYEVIVDQLTYQEQVARSAANRSMNAQLKMRLPIYDYYRSFLRRSKLRVGYASEIYESERRIINATLQRE